MVSRKLIEQDFNRFTNKNLKKPAKCRNIDQIRSYIHQLSIKIEEFRLRFDYVPGSAYILLSEYNAYQNSILHRKFIKTYGSAKH